MNSNKTQQSQLTDDWLELGAEVTEFICKKLSVKPEHIDVASVGREAAFLAKGVGLAALASLRHEIAKGETQKILDQLVVSKSELGQLMQPNQTNQPR